MATSARVEQTIKRLQGLDALQLDMPAPVTSGHDLSGDHPFFTPAQTARDAVREALERGETHYADVPGIAPLRQAVAESLQVWGVRVSPQDGLMISAGEQEARFLAVQTLARSGYRVALPAVVHPGARKAAALGQVAVERFASDPVTMSPELNDVRRVVASGQVALYLESPNRLTGKVIDRQQVEAIAAEIRRTEAMVLWDATLAGWIPDQTGYVMIGALPGMEERTITLGTLWSGLGLEDWLAAYLAGPPALFGAARSLKQIIAICTTTPAQWGVLGALKAGAGNQRTQRDALLAQRAAAAREWPQGLLPGEAASLLAVRRPRRPVDFDTLPARPMSGEPFGMPGVLRFTVSPSSDLADSLRALAVLDVEKGRRP
jgi:aspartate/methionine/tyrosine aminotransferase